MDRIEIDMATGAQKVVQMTPEEILQASDPVTMVKEKCAIVSTFSSSKYSEGIVYGGNTYQIDGESQKTIGLRVSYAMNSVSDPTTFPWGHPYDKGWWDVNNAYHAMTAAEFMVFAKAVSDYCSCLACCAREHKSAITVENCETYDYSTGWPVQP
ncbi:MAG: hypothetical protein WC047_00495 [Kiritimatiellales bacterium]